MPKKRRSRAATGDEKGANQAPATRVTTPQPRDEVVDLTGKSFQEAQDIIVHEMITLRDQEGQEISEPFHNLPTRKLTDYYALIKKPVSLKAIQKLVRGKHGRQEASGVSDFKSWKAYEEEFSYIWRNAWEYNEDGSDISLLATQLQRYFTKRMAQARQLVPEPAQPGNDGGGPQRLKLKMTAPKSQGDVPGQKIMLRVGGAAHRPSDSPHAPSPVAPANDPQTIIGRDAAQDQRSGSSGATRSVSFPTATAAPATTPLASAAPPTPALASVKAEAGSGPFPLIGPAAPIMTPVPVSAIPGPVYSTNVNEAAGAMLPPSALVPSKGSASPIASTAPQGTLPTPPTYTPPLDSRWRPADSGVEDAYIRGVVVRTHSALAQVRPLHVNISASRTSKEQQRSIALPASHALLDIVSILSDRLAVRPHRHCLRLNCHEIEPLRQARPLMPRFTVPLAPGVNRIDVEIWVGPPKETPDVTSEMTDYERVTIFAHLLKW